MSLNIKNEETERLARRLAALTGETLTGALTTAVRERLDRVQHDDLDAEAERLARIRELGADAGPRWVEPQRSGTHGDLLYDELGLPR